MDYLYKHLPNNNLFPKPYFKYDLDIDNFNVMVGQTDNKICMCIGYVYKIIVYEFLEGNDLTQINYN